MSDPVINVEAVARRVVANRGRVHTVSVDEIVAMCVALVRIADTLVAVSPELALAIDDFIARESDIEALDERDEPGLLAAFQARDAAFNTLKILFETEFHHD